MQGSFKRQAPIVMATTAASVGGAPAARKTLADQLRENRHDSSLD
jgi:hypothetical protein